VSAHASRCALALLAGLVLGAPGASADGAPASARGELVIEPPRIRLGDVATVEQVVVTPPGVSVRPAAEPAGESADAIGGFWVLEREPLAVEREPQRWIHRTRLRIRARDVGSFGWPAQRVVLESDTGARETLEIPGRTIDVISVLEEFPDRDAPFGLRGLGTPGATPGGALVPALAGAVFTLATLGLVLLVRRERRRRAEQERALAAEPPGLPPPDAEARAALDAAAADTDPRHAADGVSRALRRFAERRFRSPALVMTTDELARVRPGFVAESRWRAFVSILRSLDDVRFRPPRGDDADRVATALAAARAFVAGGVEAPSERAP
jgi:hypothetical protein